MRHRLLVAVATVILAACQSAQPSFDVTEPDVSVGAERSCADLQLSSIRCTVLVLRAVEALDAQRPGHAAITSRSLHAEGDPPAGQTRAPRTTTIPIIVVFDLANGSHVAVPVHCPRNPPPGDEGCDPRVT